MSSIPDYYAILQISSNAEPEIIVAAYRSLAKKYHPDTNPDQDVQERMKAINIAYEVLSNPQKRARYDQLRKAAEVLPKVTPSKPPPYEPTSSSAHAPEGVNNRQRQTTTETLHNNQDASRPQSSNAKPAEDPVLLFMLVSPVMLLVLSQILQPAWDTWATELRCLITAFVGGMVTYAIMKFQQK